MTTKTFLPSETSLEPKWYVIDAADQRLGRLASEVARIIREKINPFTPLT